MARRSTLSIPCLQASDTGGKAPNLENACTVTYDFIFDDRRIITCTNTDRHDPLDTWRTAPT
jgi:hypothetical protein